MHDIPNRIADVLLEVESILRASGKWEMEKPGRNALSSTQPFCIDTLRFEQWLQWIFLPRMKQTLEEASPLPSRSGIHPYAEEYLPKKEPYTKPLLEQIQLPE